MRLSSCEVVFLQGFLPVSLSFILNQPYRGFICILSLDFKFQYFPGVGVRVGGCSGEIKIKALLIPAEPELGMSLANKKIHNNKFVLQTLYVMKDDSTKVKVNAIDKTIKKTI